MKVNIGKYKQTFNCYQITDLLKYVGVKEELCDKFGDYLTNTCIQKVFDFLNAEQRRKVYVKIDNYDTWSMDSTLSLIILPMLKQLQLTKHGSPLVCDSDVPEPIKSTSAPPKENEWNVDENLHKRWDWVLDEMIWTFQQLQPDYDWQEQYCKGNVDLRIEETTSGTHHLVKGPNYTYEKDIEAVEKHQKRIDNGLRLFGKYYQSLWD